MPSSPPAWRRPTPLLAAVSALFALPVLVARFPPMVDYPQHLAMAAVYRFYGDAERGFAENFALTWWRPHGAWELLTAALARVMPIELAGKLLVAASVAALAPAALAVLRRRGGDGWWPWALAALACGYGYAFWFGFVGSLLAYPLFLAGVALADRALAGDGRRGDRAPSPGWWALVALGLLFYAVHLQFLFLLVAAVGCLTLCHRGAGGARCWRPLAALVPGVGLALAALASARLADAGSLSPLERAMAATPAAWNPLPVKLATMSGLTFGIHGDGSEFAVSLLLLAVAVLAVLWRRRGTPERKATFEVPATFGGRRGRPVHGEVPAAFSGWGENLRRQRFAVLAAALLIVYLAAPERVQAYLVAGRIAPLAVMVACCALPPPRAERRRLLACLLAVLVACQLAVVAFDVRAFDRETAGLDGLLATTAAGRDLLGLVFEPTSVRVPAFPIHAHLPAYYQVRRGGRVLNSMADFFHTPVAYRPGRDWGGLPVLLSERNPQDFDLRRDGGRFDYVLVRGDADRVRGLFAGVSLPVRSAGRWHLVALPSGVGRSPSGVGPATAE